MDSDYVSKLSQEEKEWLSKFNNEYYGNTFSKTEKNLHKKKDHKKVYDQTNARNRDMYNNRYKYQDAENIAGMDGYAAESSEDAKIDYIDYKRKIEETIENAIALGYSDEEAQELAKSIYGYEDNQKQR